MAFLDQVPLEDLLWLVPVFFLLHNLEEAPFMESWSKRLPLKIHPSISTRQFTVAVSFLTLAGFLVTYFAIRLHHSTGYLLVLGIQGVLFFNAFVPHIASTIYFRMYSPGVITATVITIPFSIYLFRRALLENMMSWQELWILLAIAPFAMVLFAYLSLQIGKALDRSKRVEPG